jgi:hypothetical protein
MVHSRLILTFEVGTGGVSVWIKNRFDPSTDAVGSDFVREQLGVTARTSTIGAAFYYLAGCTVSVLEPSHSRRRFSAASLR